MVGLEGEHIELINAHGPYNHSSWSNGDICITNEDRLAGRGTFLVKVIRSEIEKRFSLEQIREMTIVDVGCYDGWILHQLSDLPFKRMVGVEPRQKNIDKGKFVRSSLGITNSVEMVCDDLRILLNESFDIVLCNGVIHHLESLPEAIKTLSVGTNSLLFIETICLSTRHITQSFIKEIEMKDMAYNFQDKICGISGQKYESSVYDGSATNLSVVSIPSIETILMSLRTEFENAEVVANPEEYKKALSNYDRPANAVCVLAENRLSSGNSKHIEAKWIKNYENSLRNAYLGRNVIEKLYQLHAKGKSVEHNFASLLIDLHMRSKGILSNLCMLLIKRIYKNKEVLEIIRNLKYNPEDKIGYEYGKILYRDGEYAEAILVLQKITQKINADWRSVYRSFFLLNEIYKAADQISVAKKYLDLYEIARPKNL